MRGRVLRRRKGNIALAALGEYKLNVPERVIQSLLTKP